MRSWLLALLYAALVAAVTIWVRPTDALVADFLARAAVLVAPFRLALYVEERCGCWLDRVWS